MTLFERLLWEAKWYREWAFGTPDVQHEPDDPQPTHLDLMRASGLEKYRRTYASGVLDDGPAPHPESRCPYQG